MLTDPEKELMQTLKLNAGVDSAQIDASLEAIGGPLPEDYRELLMYANGGAGFVANGAFVDLWSIIDMVETYVANDVARLAPGMLPFASDGGGNVFAFDRRSSPMTIVEAPLIGISWEIAKVCAESVGQFLRYLART